jgi:glycosyltransferase involved in cell wall biosynthesis
MECGDLSVVDTDVKSCPRILFLVTEDWYFCMHWIALARATRHAGFEVLLAMRVQKHGQEIRREGFKLFPIRLLRRSLNPIRESIAVLELARLYRSEKPDLIYHVGLKPILYGSVAARLVSIPHIINVFAGLGYAFTSEGLKARLFRLFLGGGLKAAFMRAQSIAVFQNEEDRIQLTQDRIVERNQTRVIPGMGVDTDRFKPAVEKDGKPIVLLACRMLWDKGVGEFVEAARLLSRRKLKARFVLTGRCDEDHPASIRPKQMQQWQEEGVVEWWGHRNDMPAVLGGATLVVLPSYREGIPVSLLEAAACGKAIVATDVPGCREVVRHRVNGLLVPPRDAVALADAVAMLVENEELRHALGRRGREIVVKEFSAAAVIGQTLALYHELLHRSS